MEVMFHPELQNLSRFLCLFHKTATVERCPGEQFPNVQCESVHDNVYATNHGEMGDEPQ